MNRKLDFPDPAHVQLGGVLGRALEANHRGRLAHFIKDERSAAIALFAPEHASHNHEGDWYGEHAGKWLYAAARAARRTGDAALGANVRRIAEHLVSLQDADGYLGTYAPERRFMRRQSAATRTWDGAPSRRTWDIWTHSHLILGLLEAGRYFASPACVQAARKIGDLCWRTITQAGIDITDLGNHHGMSATVLLDPAVELYFATRDKQYLDLAQIVLHQANRRAELELLPRAMAGVDAAEIATGKSYQLCWNLVGLAKLHRATGDARYLTAVQKVWDSIREFHLTLGGGPWGGVGHRSREVFNHRSVFSPYGYVETCATCAWIQLNSELLGITGEARYADEIERSAYNDLLGAQAPNGEDWCYYSFPNGRRVHTTYWRCCKSSGAMALEELPPVAYGLTAESDIAVNLYGPGHASLALPGAGTVRLEQITRYPFDGAIRIAVEPEQPAQFSILVRVPGWAREASIQVNGRDCNEKSVPGTFLAMTRNWQKNDAITLQLPMPPVVHEQASRSVQESRAPDGTPIDQEVMRYEYVAITRGPLVYATTLIDGFKSEETLRIPQGGAASLIEAAATPEGCEGPALRLSLGYRPALTFVPYYEAGGRQDGAWRLTWMPVVPIK